MLKEEHKRKFGFLLTVRTEDNGGALIDVGGFGGDVEDKRICR